MYSFYAGSLTLRISQTTQLSHVPLARYPQNLFDMIGGGLFHFSYEQSVQHFNSFNVFTVRSQYFVALAPLQPQNKDNFTAFLNVVILETAPKFQGLPFKD